MTRLFVDGVEGAGIRGDDPGLLLGLTAFETMRTYGRVVFRLEQHLDRLEASARMMDIPLPPRSQMVDEIRGRAEDNARIRYTLTAGGHRVLEVAALDLSKVGASVSVARLDWNPPRWLPGAVKHGSRAAWIIAASRLGVDQVILVDDAGLILEANRSNVFGVVDGIIHTPPLDGRFLSGITRGALIEAAKEADLPLEVAPLPFANPFEELYLSSTTVDLAPVTRVGEGPGPGGGPIGAELLAAFRRLVARETA